MSTAGAPKGAHSGWLQRGNHNPLVIVVLVIAGLLSISLSKTTIEFAYVAALFVLLCLFLGLRLIPLGRSIRLMLPWTMAFFAIHLTFSYISGPRAGLVDVLRREFIILLRFIGLAGAMGVLREGMDAQSLVDSIKTLMDRLRVRSRRVEDFLQILRLILVFIPQVMREYQSLERFNLALGFTPPGTLRERIRFYGGNLLPVMSRSLTRARQLGEIMTLRGYGRAIPRGQLTPLPFRLQDSVAVAVIAVLLGSSGWVF
ncbi:MAG: hypothetical protein JSU77_11590 [Fidelibacterota bacterium]|nr:MAG: hypothetical protein JSU77_11590 [Candidatus Neomarinimicrobiota bacterium]